MDSPCAISLSLLSFMLLFPSLLAQPPAVDLTTQLDALLSVKSSISYDPSDALASWNDSSRFCQWSGVLCTNQGQVSALDLSGLGLEGTISPSIGNLSSLQFLYLQENQFHGELPLQLGGLRHLEVLNASSNSIGGDIPPNITSCTNLTSLDLSMNIISGQIPANLHQLSKLQVLNFGRNQLTGTIPPTTGNLSSLQVLNLGTNTIHGAIPSDLGRLHKLKVLHLSINNLTGQVPPSLYNVSSLVTFELASNDLNGEIPSDIGFRLPNLRDFHFCINKFTGRIPPSLHNVTELHSLRISNNMLTGPVPPGLGNLHSLAMYNIGFNRIVSSGANGLDFVASLSNSTKLNMLAIDENLLDGFVPESVGNLSKSLSKFYLGGNRISGKIPATIGWLTNLTLLNMSHNLLSGEIPQELGGLKQLIILSLDNNRLSGEIPSDLGKLSQLTKLELNGNQLGGHIPSTFGHLQNLLTLDASSNKFQGSIPRELFTLSSLSSVLNLSHNELTGPVPQAIGDLENVRAIDLSENLLTGGIPSSIGKCRSLQILSMSNDSFSGPIPEALGDLKGLQSLDLSMNQLSGLIPDSLAKIQALQFLNLSFNNLQGDAPSGGVFANRSGVHLEGNNKLCTSSFCRSHRRRSSPRALLAIILVAVAFMLCLVGIMAWIVFLKARASKVAKIVGTTSSIKGQHPMISYEELHQATDGFDVGNRIGSGSFGSVYKGVLRDGLKVAVKVLNQDTSRALKSFFAECDALRNVRHRNLVKLVTLCLSLDFRGNEFRALVYEFMGNGSLAEWIGEGRTRGGLGLLERLGIAIDVASALDYLHNDGEMAVVHCDVKPSNVLLDEEMMAKMGDFGLAKVFIEKTEGEEESTTVTHGLKGSIGYIPPEYGFGGRLSAKGDVYSYGVMLLELFTGKSPTDELFIGDLSLVRWIRAALPDELDQVVDEQLLMTGSENSAGYSGRQQMSSEKKAQCLVSIIGIGLSCVEESPHARLGIRDVLHQLRSIRDKLMKPAHLM